MAIAYYISAHGFGHAARSVQILRELPASIALHIKTGVPEWFFSQEIRRPFTYIHDTFDCGAMEDARGVDRLATLSTYASIAQRNAQRLREEAGWLRSIGARCVASDIAPFPLRAAAEAGIPGCLVANFTWFDIYEPYVADYPRFQPMLDAMFAEYRLAHTTFVTPPSLPMPYLPHAETAGLVARRGRNRREELAQSLGLSLSRPLILFYAGKPAMGFPWHRLESMREYAFATFMRANGALPPNAFSIEPGRFSHPDVLASADAVVAKAGYGMAGECLVNARPMLYTDREHFAEFAALDEALRNWGGAIRIPRHQFYAGEWDEALPRLMQLKPEAAGPCDGASRIAQRLMEVID